jgi:hypothetical protein
MPTTLAVFCKYLNNWFVETGTYHGDGVAYALAAGFPQARSVELSPKLFSRCQQRFSEDKRVRLWQGDSSLLLQEMIEDIQEPITFWLDGHYSCGETARGQVTCPVLQELEIIGRHPLREHTLLIDDVRLLDTDEFERVGREHVLAAVRAIRPDYEIFYEDGEFPGHERLPQDILVARPPRSTP